MLFEVRIMYSPYLDYCSDFSLIFRLGCLVRKDRTRLYFSFQFVVPHIILCYTLDTLIELHMWYLHYPPLNYITCFLFSAFQLLLDQGIMKLSLRPIHMHRFVQFNISLCDITPRFNLQEMSYFWDIQLSCYGLNFLLLSIALKNYQHKSNFNFMLYVKQNLVGLCMRMVNRQKKKIKVGSKMNSWSFFLIASFTHYFQYLTSWQSYV